MDDIMKFAQWLSERGFLNTVEVNYDWDEHPYESVVGWSAEEVVEMYLEDLDG
jgi:hypothetical protein